MHRFNLIGSALMLVLCCAVFPRKKAEREVALAGQLVPVQVLRTNCNTSARFRSFHFIFQDREHSLKVGRADCDDLRKGSTMLLQHLDAYPDVFLIPGYYSKGENWAWVGLFVMGTYGVVSSWRHLRKEKP